MVREEGAVALPALLRQQTGKYGDKPLLIQGGRSVSYEKAVEEVGRLARGFCELGVEKGDKVLLLLDSHVDFVLAWWALAWIGAVEVPVNTAYKGDILAYTANNCDARVMVVEPGYLARILDVGDELDKLEVLVIHGEHDQSSLERAGFSARNWDDLFSSGAASEPEDLKANDVMAMMYTSGTTGPSKGVLVPYGHAYSYSVGLKEAGLMGSEDVYINHLPLFHIGGQWFGVLSSLICGATVALCEEFHASTYWEEVNRYEATITLMLGAMGNFLDRQPPGELDSGNALRKVVMVPVLDQYERFEERFRVRVLTVYGLTEGSLPIFADRIYDAKSCGRLRDDFEAAIVDDADRPLPDGEVGELCVRPKIPWSTMAGYYKMPEQTVEVWRNLWLHTGDKFYRDAEGNYFFVDRNKDVIRRRGENISSFEVESAVNGFPSVLESAAVAVPSEHTEDEIKAVVTPKPGETVDPTELSKFLEGRLPHFMVPRYLEVVDALPKTPTQKIKKETLRQQGLHEGVWDREKSLGPIRKG